MRAGLIGLAVLAALAPSAAAQATGAVAPNVAVQLQQAAVLDGVWRISSLGDLTLTTRPDEVLVGRLEGRRCHGQYRRNTFSILCPAAGRGPYIISGEAFRVPLERTQRGAAVAYQGARMNGQIHQTYLESSGHTEELARFTANRP